MTFRVYYDDGSIYEGDPFNAPGLGVICILDACHDQPHLHEKSDYYIWKFKENGWTGVDIFGLFDYLTHPGERKVLFGRTVDNDLFSRIRMRAYKELVG